MHELSERALDIAYHDFAYRDEEVLDALLAYRSEPPEQAEDIYRRRVRPRIARLICRRRREIVRAARAAGGSSYDH